MPVKIYPTVQDFVELRFAFSPIWEIITSFRVLQNVARHALYLSWVNETLPLIQELELDFMTAIISPEGYIPDFLTPTPTTPHPQISQELEELAATSSEQVQFDIAALNRVLGQTSPLRQQFLDQPQVTLQQLIRQIHTYWEVALAGHWQRMVSVLEGDVLFRARQLALHGAEHLFSDLHPMVQYNHFCIEIATAYSEQLHLDGRGLLLVPVIFSWPDIYVQTVPSWRPMLVYNARGAGAWQVHDIKPNVELSRLIGGSKAQILYLLTTPTNNKDLARQLGLTNGAVSQHIKQLRGAGLVNAVPQGRWVYYYLTERGEAIVALFATE